MRKGEIACYKQFLLFSQCFPHLYIYSVSKCWFCGYGFIHMQQWIFISLLRIKKTVGLTLYHTIPAFKDPKKRKLLKTLWEKEKMLVTSIFSFSHNVFHPPQIKTQDNIHICFVVCKCFQFGAV